MVRWAIASGAFSSTSTWNDGGTLGIPTTGDDVFTNGFTVNMDVNATVNSLNNSARARGIAIPIMTSDSTPNPYNAAVSSNTNTYGASAAFQVFDRNSSTIWAANAATGWVSIDVGTSNSVVIDGYTVFGSPTTSANPRNWTFEGSNDNVNWTVLQTVTLGAPISSNGSNVQSSIGNTTAYRYYRLNISLNGGFSNVFVSGLELYQPGTAALAAGGSFNFNTAGVTVTCTSTSASLSAGATNLITVTATTGAVTLNLGSSVTGLSTASTQIFNYTGNCNFNLSGVRFSGGSTTSALCINKTSSGTITITGDMLNSNGGTNSFTLSSNNGNTIVNGNIFGGISGTGLTRIISQSAGNITVTGNVTGGQNTSNDGIFYSGSGTITVNGNVLGGTGIVNPNYGINTTGPLIVNGNVLGGFWPAILSTSTVTITGTVTAAVLAAISSTSANTINVTGDVYASATANGISSTNASGVVNLTGNMYNGLGRNAIYCQNVFISNTATTLWRVDTGGGNYKFLYSADTTPNLPPITDVRFGTTYGPALSLTGTMVVPAASDVRENVAVDNTVGTGELTSADIIIGINASSDPLAVRLKNALTDVTAGNIISQYKDS